MTEPKKRDLLIFPTKVRLGSLGEARLGRIERSPRGPTAVYEVEPGDEEEFKEAVRALRDQFNLTYQPTPALWSSWRLLDDDLVLQVGLDQQAGKARADAFRALKPKHNALVSEAEVKALAMGYLLRVGAEV